MTGLATHRMQGLCLWLAGLTALALALIVLAGLLSHGAIVGHSAAFGLLVNAMYVLLLSASACLTYACWRQGARGWSVLFAINFWLVLVPMLLKQAGQLSFGAPFLFGLDIYWLVLFLTYLYRRVRA